jgi:hypothetical protein
MKSGRRLAARFRAAEDAWTDDARRRSQAQTAGSVGGAPASTFGLAAFRFFFDRSRACSNVHNVTTVAIANGTKITIANNRYSCVPIRISQERRFNQWFG